MIYNPTNNRRKTGSNDDDLDSYVPEEQDFSDTYPGPYTVTPNTETQTLNTMDFTLERNIVVNPIPSNYGLITWNGSTLTVS